jgi:hypothetical protein
MSFYSTVQKINGFYEFPRIGKNKFKPLRVTDLRDPRIQEAYEEIKKEIPDPNVHHNQLLELWGYVERDSEGNYAPISEGDSVIENAYEIETKANFDNLVKSSVQFTIDPNLISVEAMAELFRNLPRNKQYIATQNEATYTMNDKVRNEIVHSLIAHQNIVQTDSEKWIEDAVTGGQPFTISEHTYVKEGGYNFKDPSFFNHLFTVDIPDFLWNYSKNVKFSRTYLISQNTRNKAWITKNISRNITAVSSIHLYNWVATSRYCKMREPALQGYTYRKAH